MDITFPKDIKPTPHTDADIIAFRTYITNYHIPCSLATPNQYPELVDEAEEAALSIGTYFMDKLILAESADDAVNTYLFQMSHPYQTTPKREALVRLWNRGFIPVTDQVKWYLVRVSDKEVVSCLSAM